ncbi:MAG: AAA family ATPase, partial [bacterium]|nr:AAA family ATPase [bacterium]
MLTKLRIRNFKCFEDHTVPFSTGTTVVVGRNNAGKSTIVEALRLIAIVSSRYQSLNYHDVPSWLDIPRIQRGVAPDISNIEFNQEATFFQYSDPPSILEGTYSNGASITVYLGADQSIHAVIKGLNDKPIRNRGEAQEQRIPRISIMPQIGPVSKSENRLSDDYVRRALSSPLSSSHFRNQLRVIKESF